MRVAGYLRVSTVDQNCDMQRHALQRWLDDSQASSVTWFQDAGVSGKTLLRPALQLMMAAIARGEIDTVLVYRLDRISRNAAEALQLILAWLKRDLQLIVVDQPILNATLGDPFRLTKLAMFSELAQVERDVLVSRTKAGLQAAKARGVRLGAKRRLTAEQAEQVRQARASGATCRELSGQYGVSVATITRLGRES